MGDHQRRIERGRLLTQSEFEPQQTLASYRENLIKERTQRFDGSTTESKAQTCAGIAAVLGGTQVPGEWPGRK